MSHQPMTAAAGVERPAALGPPIPAAPSPTVVSTHLRPHEHLWKLSDGTGLHAPPAVLVLDPDTGRLCCHLCGQFFRSLGSHVRAHGHTADTYRTDMGLCRGQALTDGGLSGAIADRQREQYETSPEIQLRFTEGRQRAQRGHGDAHEGAAPISTAAAALQAEARAVGLATRRTQRQVRLDAVVAAAGFSDLGAMLRDRYAAGASLEALAEATGLGRSALRKAIDEAGIVVRSTGKNTDAGRRSRAGRADREAAIRVGTDDLRAWLRERREAGWTWAQLGDAVGHSGHWVRCRVEAAQGAASNPASA